LRGPTSKDQEGSHVKRRLQTSFAALALLAVTIGGRAYGHDPYNDDRNGRDGYSYGTGGYSGSLVDQVSRDLATVRSNSRVDGHERDHFDTVQRELAGFQRRWAQGRFDNGRLDRAISSLSHLVNSDQIDPRGRRVLAGAFGRVAGETMPHTAATTMAGTARTVPTIAEPVRTERFAWRPVLPDILKWTDEMARPSILAVILATFSVVANAFCATQCVVAFCQPVPATEDQGCHHHDKQNGSAPSEHDGPCQKHPEIAATDSARTIAPAPLVQTPFQMVEPVSNFSGPQLAATFGAVLVQISPPSVSDAISTTVLRV